MNNEDYKRGYRDGYQDGVRDGTPKKQDIDPAYPGYTPLKTKCIKCGMVFEGAMGYYCPDSYCPMQPRGRAYG